MRPVCTVLESAVVLGWLSSSALALPEKQLLKTDDFSTCSTDRNAAAYGLLRAKASLPHIYS